MSEIQLVNLDDYKQTGEGGNGKTYVNPAIPGEILKVNNAPMSTWEAVKRDYDVSRATHLRREHRRRQPLPARRLPAGKHHPDRSRQLLD